MRPSDLASLRGQGFAFIPRHFPERDPLDAFAALGVVVSVADRSVTQPLHPRRLDESPPNIYSGNYGLGAFPLHTDLAHWYVPPRYLALRCIVGVSNVYTVLLDGRVIQREIGASALRRTLVQPRRSLNGMLPLLRILDDPQGLGTLLRWDSLFIKPASDASAATFNRIQAILGGSSMIRLSLTSPGDTLIIDNWRILHGRSAVPRNKVERHLERAYLGRLL